MRKILIVEDEPALVEALDFALSAEGFTVVTSFDGHESLAIIDGVRPDLVVLDVMLPGLSGIEVCRRVRSTSAVPIIMLTARDHEVDRVLGLELGADDYITKPFSMREVVARIRAVLRRTAEWRDADLDAVIEVADLRLDVERHEVTVAGAPVQLPPKEFAVLELLLRNAGRVVSRDVIIDRVWGEHHMRDTKTLDVHIKRLRDRLEADRRAPRLILTVRGVGYKFSDDWHPSSGWVDR